MFDSRVRQDQAIRGRLTQLYLDHWFQGGNEKQVRDLLYKTDYLGESVVSERINGAMGPSLASERKRSLDAGDRAAIENCLKPFGPDPLQQTADQG